MPTKKLLDHVKSHLESSGLQTQHMAISLLRFLNDVDKWVCMKPGCHHTVRCKNRPCGKCGSKYISGSNRIVNFDHDFTLKLDDMGLDEHWRLTPHAYSIKKTAKSVLLQTKDRFRLYITRIGSKNSHCTVFTSTSQVNIFGRTHSDLRENQQ